jgi:hypothetical protein
MKSIKYVPSGGLAFTEKRDMQKLSKYAKKGWLLERFAPFGYKLRKGDPQTLEYSVDYHTNVDEEYYSIFEDAGWSYVCSAGEAYHVFRAAAGTAPIYTDTGTLVDKYEREKKSVGKLALPLLIAMIVFIFLGIMGANGWLPEIVMNISRVLGIVTLVMLVFPGLPYIAYRFKLNKLREHK